MKTNQRNFIHVKYDYDEVVQSKKDILSSEMSLIKILKIIQRYKTFRAEELKVKLKLKKIVSEVVSNISSMQKELPKIEVEEMKKTEDAIEEFQQTTKKIKEKKYESSLESQIQEIQDRLKSLEI